MMLTLNVKTNCSGIYIINVCLVSNHTFEYFFMFFGKPKLWTNNFECFYCQLKRHLTSYMITTGRNEILLSAKHSMKFQSNVFAKALR